MAKNNNKKTLRILYFFVVPVLALFGGFHVSDTYLGTVHFGNAVLGYIVLFIAAACFLTPIIMYMSRGNRR